MSTYIPSVREAPEFCWKDIVGKENVMEQRGLEELFGGNRSAAPAAGQQQLPRRRRAFLPQDEFFTLRMEHRVGGAMARHVGEERILLFRSDRAGAVAKVIYSSVLNSSGRPRAVPTAKIHVLDVKEPYRGRDLGGLLFAEAVTSLMDSYADVDCEGDRRDDGQDAESGSNIHCVLDAEEDVRRHNRLVGFYQQLGCHVKPRAKVQMLYNGPDTYRKVPMQIDLAPAASINATVETTTHSAKFLPVSFWSNTGLEVGLSRRSLESVWTSSHEEASHDRRVDWLVVEAPDGCVMFRTTQGHYMRVGDRATGGCTMTRDAQSASKFFVYKVRDDPAPESRTSKELFLLQCTLCSCFLAVDGSSHLTYSDRPAFWQVDRSMLSLTCTTDTPRRRQHYLTSWKTQTVSHVRQMRQRYLKFDLTPGGLSFREALDLVKTIPAHPFTVGQRSPSIRTVCYKTAEAARNAGQPDWVQFIALTHLLGSAVTVLNKGRNPDSDDNSDYDWTIASRTRIVGCPAPECATFGEFRHLNPDERNPNYSRSPQGMYNLHCGLDQTLLTWTGPEYMYHMLAKNDICIPEEGLAMLRLFSLGDWHAHGEYSHLQSIADEQGLLPFVSEFDDLRRSVPPTVSDLTDEECDDLYETHYEYIVEKYVIPDEPILW
mmetsp:Transcript_19896/g.29443  ORF Transcript_19896/g.29443 Transcript_19896/m.29443 type:complete len:657 (-) Transcript_19896:216-2186(-)|eukprot:CAMPEP_0194047652 /NCGR_PEP_ID=MMETSP0009_2-20130614/25094_1 /TAXON_ID=210454 /ORGANISM="Grammatophora oceanica, Strain CCMP 410" /LENGTH=656 /DNA_ID=CAMNT_0038693323 /DNA_START=98 /DNA_END=2068 /DNA_ORIENTATION=-